MERIAFFGATGTMGSATITELMSTKREYSFSFLLLPYERLPPPLRDLLRKYGLTARPPGKNVAGPNVQENDRIRIVWGDARDEAAVRETIRGADWVFNTMALISPAADTQPELARQINDEAIQSIIEAICDEPDGANRIRLIHTGSVAQTGSRPPGFHLGRIGDPMNPSVFDQYAITKIDGERRVMESPLKYWVSLRMSFIMPTDHQDLLRLFDPILFHMPLDTHMESISDRDAGFAMTQCLKITNDSSFWQRALNIGGGPRMRMTAIDYFDAIFHQLGLDWKQVTRRNWFALRNFHMQYFDDSSEANGYLEFWRDSNTTFQAALLQSMRWYFRAFGWLNNNSRLFNKFAHGLVYTVLRRMAEKHPNSPRNWYLTQNDRRIKAFFKSSKRYEEIPSWGDAPEYVSPNYTTRFTHGYNNDKLFFKVEDIQEAARFRGGSCDTDKEEVHLSDRLEWECAFGHRFELRVRTVLHGGHWCPICTRTWNGDERAKKDHFFAQAWYSDHDPSEQVNYIGDDYNDSDPLV